MYSITERMFKMSYLINRPSYEEEQELVEEEISNIKNMGIALTEEQEDFMKIKIMSLVHKGANWDDYYLRELYEGQLEQFIRDYADHFNDEEKTEFEAVARELCTYNEFIGRMDEYANELKGEDVISFVDNLIVNMDWYGEFESMLECYQSDYPVLEKVLV